MPTSTSRDKSTRRAMHEAARIDCRKSRRASLWCGRSLKGRGDKGSTGEAAAIAADTIVSNQPETSVNPSRRGGCSRRSRCAREDARTIAAALLCARCPVRILLVGSSVASAPQVDESLVPDDVLAEWARIGSPSAFAELVERHREAVYTIVRNLCRTATDTEETLHEAFLTAWHDLRAFPSGVRFSTWLHCDQDRLGVPHAAIPREAHIQSARRVAAHIRRQGPAHRARQPGARGGRDASRTNRHHPGAAARSRID